MLSWTKSWWRQHRTRELFARIPELSEKKILEALSVEKDNPLLVAIMHILKGYEEMAVDSAAGVDITAETRAYHAGGIGWLADAQERILQIAEEGRKRRAGG
ncbi:MAG: hypothetical protein PHX05_00150 [Acidobacteriota bacterium]|nr:hypothetical protein [Acidobacteriota bacterium]